MSKLQTLKNSSTKKVSQAEPSGSSASKSGHRDENQQNCFSNLTEMINSGGKHQKVQSNSPDAKRKRQKSNKKEKSKEPPTADMIELVALRASEEESRQALHAVRLENISLRDSQTKFQSKIKTLEKKNGELSTEVDAL